ncbi:kinase-like protein [Phlegmacium glaucopus]|nr:kinase-like protein [Phlegmacium glaucopus]
MSSFPEEPLNLSPSEGGGHYPAAIAQKLNGDKYEIVRKLGYGPRSSTWLVLRAHNPEYYVVKIFSVAASERAKTVELPIIKAADKLSPSLGLPVFHGSFWEESSAGSHLCFVMNPLSTSVQDLQRGAEKQQLPVHVVQRIVWSVSSALKGLHNAKIMHGQIKAENIFFSTATQIKHLKPVLDSEPPPTTLKVKKYTTTLSQPLKHSFKWNDKKKVVVDWLIHLDNLGHAQRWNYKPEKNADYLSAPETLLQGASCSPQTDIWMLGCLTFSLLTGNALFHLNGNTSKRIAAMRAALEDDVPEEWLSDNKMKDYNAEHHGLVTSIEAGLSDVLNQNEAAQASAFIKGCLRLDPQKRLKVGECANHEWLAMANACSCAFC